MDRNLTLLSLPPEIQTSIVSHLLPSSIETIRSMLYVCKQLHDIALPLSVYTYQYRSAQGEQSLAFLKYITITKPFLAPSVKRIILDSFAAARNDGDLKEKRKPRNKVAADEREIYQKLIQVVFAADQVATCKAWTDDLLEELEAGFEEPIIVLLLAACTCVEHLLFVEPYHEPKLLRRFLQMAAEAICNTQDTGVATRMIPMNNLRSVYHEPHHGTRYGYRRFAKDAALYFPFPRLSSYECARVSGHGRESPLFFEIARRSSTVQHLEFRAGNISGQTLKAIVGACAHLRSFVYSSNIYSIRYGHEMLPRHLINVMLPHAETLEHLDVNFNPGEPFLLRRPIAPRERYLGVRLKELRALKTLKMTARCLVGTEPVNLRTRQRIAGAPPLIECLPENLEHLEVYSCDHASIGQLQELLHAVSGRSRRFHRLRCIRFLFTSPMHAEQIHLMCDTSSVTVEAILQDRALDAAQRCPEGEPSACKRIRGEALRGPWLAGFGVGQRIEIRRGKSGEDG